jgi:hypothetical protein
MIRQNLKVIRRHEVQRSQNKVSDEMLNKCFWSKCFHFTKLSQYVFTNYKLPILLGFLQIRPNHVRYEVATFLLNLKQI